MRKVRTFTTFLLAFLLTFITFTGEVCPVSADEYIEKSSDYTPIETWETTELAREYGELFDNIEDVSETLPMGLDDVNPITIEYTEFDGTFEEMLAAYGENIEPVEINAAIPDGEVNFLTDGGSRYGYSRLTESQQYAYDEIASAAASFVRKSEFRTGELSTGLSVTLQFSEAMDEDILYNAVQSWLYDNPQYYFLSGDVSISGISTKKQYWVLLKIDEYYVNASNRADAADQIGSVAQEWLNYIAERPYMMNGELSEDEKNYQAALDIHDLICDRIDYAYNSVGEPETAKWAHSIAGVFTAQGVVCEGYARAFQYMLNLLDVDNVYVVGMAGGGGHAWNAVKFGGSYYFVDATWEDCGEAESTDALPYSYMYFGMPESMFDKDHTRFTERNSWQTWLYDIVPVGDSTDYFYYNYIHAYATEISSDEEANGIVENARAAQRNDYTQLFVKPSCITSMGSALEDYKRIGIPSNTYGYVCFKYNPVFTVAATEVAIDGPSEVEVGSSIKITASLTPSDSDEPVVWILNVSDAVAGASVSQVARKVRAGNTLTLTGLANGTITVRARTGKGFIESNEITVKIGTGEWSNRSTIYKNGNTDNKKKTLQATKVKATDWTDSKGKTKHGKLVWVVTNDGNGVSFNSSKHTVSTKSVKTVATVSSKGVVSAKNGGTAYVYACDTGTMTYEMFTVTVDTSPTKLIVSSKPDSTNKNDVVKNTSLPIGSTGVAYIIPSVKTGTISDSNDYKVSLAKEEDAKYLQLGGVRVEDGVISFSMVAILHDTDKNKPASVKVVVTNVQSGKKTTFTVRVTNPIVEASVNTDGKDLKSKKDEAVLTLNLETAGGKLLTTDKVKVYVGKTSIKLNGKKVTVDKGATVKAKPAKDNSTITLTASKDAASPAVIGILVTESASKTYTLYILAEIDSAGHITAK